MNLIKNSPFNEFRYERQLQIAHRTEVLKDDIQTWFL